MTGLRYRIVGAWELVSCVSTDTSTGETSLPMGATPKGLILYTPDGYMSAQIQAPDRPLFSSDGLYDGKPEEHAAAGRTYIAYSGRFYVEDEGTLRHEMAVSLFSNWVGQTQLRIVELRRDELCLRPAHPQSMDGSMKTVELIWRRAPENA